MVYNKKACMMLVMLDITETIQVNELNRNAMISNALPEAVSYKFRETLTKINDSLEKLFLNFTNLPP
jgi:hypothetical protein